MTRIALNKQSTSVHQAYLDAAAEVQARAADAGLSPTVLELVNLRVSQINGCAFCLNMHSKALLEAGDTVQRIAVLPAWRDTQLFSDTERAALEIAEAVTWISEAHLDDEEFGLLREHLSDDQISLLVWAAITINAFNRVSIMSRFPVRAEK
ncbi:carboxymuconolactone decarboxylase family protein [Mycolicibacter arupensis]|jgi:AhpD family alkylhydroperoxidase|uniref:carboxymuconolactone decarboxylase family protein n=1 Tax=Mycolicibacter arupensis TaxID=342002 RepID=UPI003B3A7AC2